MEKETEEEKKTETDEVETFVLFSFGGTFSKNLLCNQNSLLSQLPTEIEWKHGHRSPVRYTGLMGKGRSRCGRTGVMHSLKYAHIFLPRKIDGATFSLLLFLL